MAIFFIEQKSIDYRFTDGHLENERLCIGPMQSKTLHLSVHMTMASRVKSPFPCFRSMTRLFSFVRTFQVNSIVDADPNHRTGFDCHRSFDVGYSRILPPNMISYTILTFLENYNSITTLAKLAKVKIMKLAMQWPMLGHKSSFFCSKDDVFSWLVEN